LSVKVAVAGLGYWGPNLARNFDDLAELTWLADLSPELQEKFRGRYPAARVTGDFGDLLADDELDAVVIATPVPTHYELAKQALEAGKHVLVEKPPAMRAAEMDELVALAADRDLVLMPGHLLLYHPGVLKLKELIDAGELGDLYYVDSVRINLGLFQHDVNVLWDLAVHDLSIMEYVLQRQPVAVSATGLAHVPGRPANIAYMTMFFDGPLIAHVHANWLSPVKVRRTLLGGSRRMIQFDDLEASEKIKVYDRGISLNSSAEYTYPMLVGYRTGDVWSPQLGLREAVNAEAEHFVDCIEGRARPRTDGMAGVRILRLLEAATQSMAAQGALVPVAGVAVA
jgi:predicted dehydrogenase